MALHLEFEKHWSRQSLPGSFPWISGPHSQDICGAEVWGPWMDEVEAEIQMWHFFKGSCDLKIHGIFHFIPQKVHISGSILY